MRVMVICISYIDQMLVTMFYISICKPHVMKNNKTTIFFKRNHLQSFRHHLGSKKKVKHKQKIYTTFSVLTFK